MKRIEIDVKKLSGKPVIKGTRIPVALIVELVAHRLKPSEIVREYPELILGMLKQHYFMHQN